VPENRSAQPLAFPYTCAADEPQGASLSEYDENGLYKGGPELAQPDALVRMIAEALVSEPPDLQRAQAERQIAAERTAYRQGLPIPDLAASTRAQRRKGLGRRGYQGLLDALRGAA
jgi:hypothetical protein